MEYSGDAMDSKAHFKQKALRCGFPDDQIQTFVEVGLRTGAKLALASSYQQGTSVDDSELVKLTKTILGIVGDPDYATMSAMKNLVFTTLNYARRFARKGATAGRWHTNLFCVQFGDVPLQTRCLYKQVCAWQARMLRKGLPRQPHLQGAPLKRCSSRGVSNPFQHTAREAAMCLEISKTASCNAADYCNFGSCGCYGGQTFYEQI
eukprot:2455929-Amphidinium_carterae.1